MHDNPFQGSWSYRSFLNDPDLAKAADDLLFGSGTIVISEGPMQSLSGSIGGEGWSLELTGSRSYGNPMTAQFQGKGVVGGSQWIYAYVGYLVPDWPDGVGQTPAMVGTVVRVIPHPGGSGGVNPAGVVASWYAVRQPDSSCG